MQRRQIISLGAGVQSSTIALMAAQGEVGPMPAAAIFADTQDESPKVYDWLNWLEKQLPFPVIRTTKGKLSADAVRLRYSKNGNYYTKPSIPAFNLSPEGKIGIIQRQCTSEYKIEMIQREIRKLRNNKEHFDQWIGISTDEAIRIKPSRLAYVTNRWPLIDFDMSRADCLIWMAEKGYPKPPRSACVYCPFHSDAEWIRLRDEEPEQFEAACQFELDYQDAMSRTTFFKGTPFFHRSCVPLSQVQFKDARSGFGNECVGVCGV